MKKILLTGFILLFSYSLQSQVLIALLLGDKLNTGNIEFGLDGGVNYSKISGMDTNKYMNSFNLGFYFDIRMKDQWFLNTGVLVKSSLGVDKLTEADLNSLGATIHDAEGGEYKQKISYFLVPALAKYKFKNHVYAEVGPQFGLMYKAWIEYNYDIDGNTARIKEDNKDLINRIEVGAAGGVGYRFLKGYGWAVGVRYHYGFTNVYKDKSGTTNSALYLKLIIPIGVSESTKEKVQDQKELNKAKKLKKKEARKKNKKANNDEN